MLAKEKWLPQQNWRGEVNVTLLLHCRDNKTLGAPLRIGEACTFHSFRTNNYKLHFLESPSGLKVRALAASFYTINIFSLKRPQSSCRLG